VQWFVEFGSQIDPKAVLFRQHALLHDLQDLRKYLTKAPELVLYHTHEGPSSRIRWLALELGLPVTIKEKQPTLRSSLYTTGNDQGGLLTTVEYGNLRLHESGAIILWLLEKYDIKNRLAPSANIVNRPEFLQILFFTTSSIDHVILDSYTKRFVEGRDTDAIQEQHAEWDVAIVPLLTNLLNKNGNQYILKQFSAADIMLSWNLWVANLLGWLEPHAELLQYWNRLKQRPYFNTVFGLNE